MNLTQPIPPDLGWILKNKAIETYFQPIISIRQQAIIGFEALSRGIHPHTSELITPNYLFNMALEKGKVVDLDRLCREKAMENFIQRNGACDKQFLFLNFDTSIIDKGVVGSGRILKTVKQLGISPSSVVIEIVESNVYDIGSLKRFIATHKKHGFLIALDDLGNGSSNLNRILHIRPDIIKIDRELISEIDKDKYKQELFKSIVSMAKRTGALIIAEGIETSSEAVTSLDLGADMLQGYYFGKPQPLADKPTEIICQKINHIAAAYRSSKIKKINSEASKRQHYQNILDLIIKKLADILPMNFERELLKITAEHPSAQSYYILDLSGIQITETVTTPYDTGGKKHGMFQASSKGSDQSLKDYHVFMHAGLNTHISSPYISLANGKPCITGSRIFKGCNDNNYILCVDFNP